MGFYATDACGRKSEVFWGEISPCEHLVQMYADDGVFLDALEGFVAGGIRVGDGVVVIATPEHRQALEKRLRAGGVAIDAAVARGQYLSLDAEQTLATFMVNGWPDDERFNEAANDLLQRAGHGSRRVRAFGEMVALLWQQGHTSATLRLEHLWHKLCVKRAFSLFCAYPRLSFTCEADSSFQNICAAHSRVLAG
jgi:hypothetical protein